jgi:ornithine cyclodeaminase
MTIPFFDAQTVAATLSYAGLVEHLRQAHCQPPPEVQRVLMQQQVAGGADNGFLIWPAWQHGSHLGVKLCTLFPQNQHMPTVQALYALFDGHNGSLLALLDGAEMTYWKTAADSALGADLLARQDAATLLVVGAGALAPHMVRAYRAIRPGLSRVLVWNRTPERAQALLAGMVGLEGIAAEVAPDLAAAVQAADIVCCVTASTSPLIQGEWLRPGTHVDLIGGYTPQMREADDAVMRRARIYVDSRWFTVEHAGDLTQAIASGVIRRADVLGDLFELCSGRVAGRQQAFEITLFKSGGGAHLDLMTAQHIAARLL